MEWWHMLLIGIGSIIIGISFSLLASRLFKRSNNIITMNNSLNYLNFRRPDIKRKTAETIEEPLKYPTPSILEEIETNLKIATEPWTGIPLPFETGMLNNFQDEINTLPFNLQEELLNTYIDIRLANSIVRLVKEFGHTTDDLNQSYINLRDSVTERLGSIKQSIETNTHSSQLTKPSLIIDNTTINDSIELQGELRIVEPILYLLAIFGAQIVANFYMLPWGLLCHIIILTVIILRSALIQNSVYQRLLLPLSLVPLLRIISLGVSVLPLGEIPPMLLHFVSFSLVFTAAVIIVNVLGYTAMHVGIRFGQLHTQLLVGLTGLVFGLLQYFALKPEPMIIELTWQEVLLPALILFISAGFLQEFIFRGLIQSSTTAVFGRLGIVYTSVLFAITHIGFLPITNIFIVFSFALFLGWVVRRTGSILGVALSYGIHNMLLYLIFPFFF